VRSVTVWNSNLQAAARAQLIAPAADFKANRDRERYRAGYELPVKGRPVGLDERLVEAGLTMIREAEMFGKTELARAVGAGNEVADCTAGPASISGQNFAALTISGHLHHVDGKWWLHIPSDEPNLTGWMKSSVRAFHD